MRAAERMDALKTGSETYYTGKPCKICKSFVLRVTTENQIETRSSFLGNNLVCCYE